MDYIRVVIIFIFSLEVKSVSSDSNSLKKIAGIKWNNVNILNGFWSNIQNTILDVTLPIEYKQCESTGRISSLKLEWRQGQPQKPHFFWDSDIAKWVEAVSYSLALRKDQALIDRVDQIVDMIENAQQEDGYFNVYYTVVEPGNRFTYLKRMHELYCAGHLIEAAVAYYDATGKRKFLDLMCKYADLLYETFGASPGKICGYDGHEEIELALVKLYRITGNEKYLELSRFFIDERGKSPLFFDTECDQRGESPEDRKYRADGQGIYSYYQSHVPVREQNKAVGHAVRAMYLYCGMVDVAAETGDRELLEACERLWKNVTGRQMYITGGIGPNPVGERFTFDHDLPNYMAYNETCASIGLLFWAHRLLLINRDGKYADVMERCLFNNILGGVSLSGDRFYYSNPLAANPGAYENMNEERSHISLMRQEWFEVACCPPNLARLVMSLGEYIYSAAGDKIYVNLYINSSTEFEISDSRVSVSQSSGYPWDGNIKLTVEPQHSLEFELNVRIPQWCDHFEIRVNNETLDYSGCIHKGFAGINRLWKKDDIVEVRIDMPVRRTEARPEVIYNCGRIALERGPIVFCIEEEDNGANLSDITITGDDIKEEFDSGLLNGVMVLKATGKRRKIKEWPEETLYRKAVNNTEKIEIKAIPFYSRLNRKPGEMLVWIKAEE